MKSRLILSLFCVLAVALLSSCQRRILPDEYYNIKSAEEREQDKLDAEKDAKAALPEIATLGEMRTWNASSGGSTVEGAMLALKDGYVWIQLKNGGTSGIPLGRLSEADQQYAKETAAKHGGAKEQ